MEKYCGDVHLEYRDYEVSMCWRRGEGSMASEVCMDKGMCKSQTAGSPGSPKMQAK